MDGTGINAIEKLVKQSHVIKVGDEHYSVHQLKRVYDDPRPQTIEVRTLSGLVEFAKSKQCEALQKEKESCLIHVVSHETVRLMTTPYGEARNRDILVVARLDRPAFQFGEWKDPEEFNIALSATPTDDLQAVMAYAGKITIDSGILIEDDGITQHASVKRGVSGGLIEKKRAPSRVTLKPHRSFAEIDQVESDFIFRVRANEESIRCALFEADSGAWKDEVAKRIKAWIWDHYFDVPVII